MPVACNNVEHILTNILYTGLRGLPVVAANACTLQREDNSDAMKEIRKMAAGSSKIHEVRALHMLQLLTFCVAGCVLLGCYWTPWPHTLFEFRVCLFSSLMN